MSKLSDFTGDADRPGLIFLAESIDLRGLEDHVLIGKEARLIRAHSEIRAELSRILEPHTKTRLMLHINPWESEGVPNGQGVEIRTIADSSQHQYWIVQHWRRLFDLQLEHALELADPGLTPLMSLTSPLQRPSGFVNAHAILNWLEENLVAETRHIGPTELVSVERAWQLLIAFEGQDEPSYQFIKKAIQDFADLKRVPARMPIYVVGLFSIIEMLLTTQQDKTTENSLSHQLKEKLTLLGNRFADPLVLKDHLPQTEGMDFKKVVSKLYAYRSKVAHGSALEFTGELQVLESHKAVCRLLRAVVRKLILQAVTEPALFRDLKSC